MAGGLAALLDDIAAMARLAAASIDDVGAAAGRASMKATGVVVDDTAVTPRYITGIEPKDELPIIKRIAIGSLRNKLLFILPIALVLSEFAGAAAELRGALNNDSYSDEEKRQLETEAAEVQEHHGRRLQPRLGVRIAPETRPDQQRESFLPDHLRGTAFGLFSLVIGFVLAALMDQKIRFENSIPNRSKKDSKFFLFEH